MERMFFFDIDDTLYDLADPFRKTCRHFFEEDVPMDGLFLAFRKHGEVSFMAVENRKMSMKEMYCYRLQKAFEDYGIEMSEEEALAFQDVYQEHQHQIEVSDEMKAFLDQYSGLVPFGILSNGPSGHQWDKVRSLGLLKWIRKEDVVVSGDVGVTKPDERIFRIAEEKAQGKQLWMIGDSFESDIAGAHKAGWHTVWINRRRRIPEDRSIVPDYTVYSEEEMIDTLRQIIEGQRK
ncbi:MAG: HAD family hydrolase [Erysipelotrichaceae bacterium]|nr:HAD family hydrolase [Erysipelotrichaceae bacterium]